MALASAWVLISGCRDAPEPPPGDVLADLALPMLEGGVFDPSRLRGKYVLIAFWNPG